MKAISKSVYCIFVLLYSPIAFCESSQLLGNMFYRLFQTERICRRQFLTLMRMAESFPKG